MHKYKVGRQRKIQTPILKLRLCKMILTHTHLPLKAKILGSELGKQLQQYRQLRVTFIIKVKKNCWTNIC